MTYDGLDDYDYFRSDNKVGNSDDDGCHSNSNSKIYNMLYLTYNIFPIDVKHGYI